jgi:uncharacterized membrane protein YeaQ/YmgE (transglycosylase-associated protein family)
LTDCPPAGFLGNESRTDKGVVMQLIIQLISGAVGGNVAGAVLKKYDLGRLGNSVAGILGGGLGGQILGALGLGGATVASGGVDLGNIVGSIAGGGVGGGVLLVIIGLIRNAMKK